VASALTAETIFEIMKCIADVDMLPRRRMGIKMRNFQVFQFWLRPRQKYFDFKTSGILSYRKYVN